MTLTCTFYKLFFPGDFKSRDRLFMKIRLMLLLSVLFNLSPINSALAELPPDLKIIGTGSTIFNVQGVNDAGQVLVLMQDGSAALWTNGSFGSLTTPPGAIAFSPLHLSKQSTTIVGSATFNDRTPNYNNAAVWFGPGPGAVVASANPQGGGQLNAVSPSGAQAGGITSFCIDGQPGCLTLPATGLSALALKVPNPEPGDNGSITSLNDAGTAVGLYRRDGVVDGGVIFNGAGFTPLGFTPRRIVNNGNIIGAQPVVLRTPDGAKQNIPCGSQTLDANDVGDILTTAVGNDTQSLWHEGACYKLSELLPDGFAGYRFPGPGIGFSVNNLGQIATMAVKPGGSISNMNDYEAVLLTPKYPLAIQVSITPTGVSGEFEFESKVLRGTPSATVTWDFGDGSAPVTGGSKIKKKYTKPGSYTAKAKVVDSNGSGITATSTKTVTVSAPTLQVGITVPNFETGEVPVDTNFQVVVNVTVANNGVGDISNIAFEGGTFTVSDGSILSFTTGATSPFSLAPGTGNSHPLNVKAVKDGSVKISTLLTGQDATGKNVSATTDRVLVIGEGGSLSDGKPNSELVKKIDAATALLKQLKLKPSKQQKPAQKEIKTKLKVLANELVSFLSAHAGEINATSAKIKLSTLAASAKKALLQAVKVKETFAADKKAANKGLGALKKGIAP